MNLHPETGGFNTAAETYERNRPGYPPEAVAWLAERLGLRPGATVADVGAGTGKLTRELVATGAEVVAVEPVPGMRSVLAESVPGVEVVTAAAEALPMADGALDAITAAQAFHWFATPPTLREFHRVLRAGGHLGLIWNRRDLADPLQAGLDAIVTPRRGASPSHESDRWQQVLDESPLFDGVGRLAVPSEQTLDLDGVVGRVLSTSFIALLDDQAREEVAAQVRDVARRTGPPFVLRYVTEAFAFVRR